MHVCLQLLGTCNACSVCFSCSFASRSDLQMHEDGHSLGAMLYTLGRLAVLPTNQNLSDISDISRVCSDGQTVVFKFPERQIFKTFW